MKQKRNLRNKTPAYKIVMMFVTSLSNLLLCVCVQRLKKKPVEKPYENPRIYQDANVTLVVLLLYMIHLCKEIKYKYKHDMYISTFACKIMF